MADMSVFTNVAPALRAVWQREHIVNSAVLSLFNVQDSASAVERTRGLGSLNDVPEYDGTIEYDADSPLDLKLYTHVQYAKGIRIQRSELDDGEYNIINRRVQNLAIATNRTISKHAASVFNNAFTAPSDNVPGAGAADGKALCATGRNSGKAVLNNKGTTAFSQAAVIATRKLMRNFKDANGNKLNVMPDTLIVPSDLEDEAIVVVESLQVPGSGNNDVNTTRNMNVVVEPLLDDTNNWFVADSRLARLHLNWFWRVRPEFAEDPKSDYDLEMRMRAYMRYSFGADASYWIYGHEVA